MATYEIEIKTSKQTLDVGSPGSPLNANLEVYNGKVGLIIPNDFPAEIPGGVINVDDTLIVRLINDLPAPIATGIHWHGIELQSNADGTPVTQNAVPGGDLQVLGGIGGSPVGGTYLYKFKMTRPGIFWFHPHHFHSTNRVFRGTYGMIIVTDPNEAALIPATLPDASNTEQLVLSDITVCGTPGNPLNNPGYVLTLPWVGPGGMLPVQPGFTPEQICDTAPVDEEGNSGVAFNLDDVPNIQQANGRINEGLTVLTNGKNVGGRAGTPTSPGAVAAGAITMNVQPGQGLRLQIVNCATTRYFRLILTTNTGAQIDLIRVGGEGGLLDNAVLEGGNIGGFDTKYTAGEILIPPASRADVVAAIPDNGTVNLTLWTQDFERLSGAPGGPFANLPTVPVLHLNVSGAVISPAYTITGGPNGVGGTPLRAATLDLVPTLGAFTANLLDPAGFAPFKLGMPNEDIQLTPGIPSINTVDGDFSGFTPYSDALKLDSSRYAKEGDLLHLTVTNSTQAHHPFHLHGFSFQPVSLTPTGAGGTFNWGYQEFRDTVDVPNGYTLAFKVQIEAARKFADDSVANTGGSLGRWLFHCHIFFHAHRGMISELVITDPDGSGDEKPNIDVGGSWTYAPTGGVATRSGTYFLPDGDTLATMVAHLDNGTPIGDITIVSGTEWDWQSHTLPDPPLPDQTNYVYVTITGNSGRKDQTVFRLKIGPLDDGSDNGDPHIHTVDGKTYHFQAVGEFTMLRDREGMEIQTRQTPGQTANTFNDSYSGLTSSVSVNTAVAARVGSHRIAYQPSAGGRDSRLQFFLDGKPAQLSTEGIDLEGHRVSAFDANGETGLRVDYAPHAVLTVTPRFSTWLNMWYMNVSVSHTQGDEGLMGSIPDSSWLPTLRSGATVGPMPAALHDRYIALYKTFANSWRVTDASSLFVYAPGTSTATFTDEDWPAETHPSTLKPQFVIPGAQILPNIDIEDAERICRAVTDGDLHRDCVFDVVTTGDETFAKGYLFAQDLKLHGSTVQIAGDKESTRPGESLVITATVSPISSGRPTPTGCVTFLVDSVAVGPPVKLDKQGRAWLTMDRLDAGDHKIRAAYEQKKSGCLFAIFAIFGGRKYSYHSSTSPNLLHTVRAVAPTV